MDWAVIALVGCAPFWAAAGVAAIRMVSAVFSPEKD